MKQETVSREVGRCLTERKLKDFDKVVETYGEFLSVSQFDKQPKHVSETDKELTSDSTIHVSEILYGVDQDGKLNWLGEIIDASD